MNLPDSFKPTSAPSPALPPPVGFNPAEAINSHALELADYPPASIGRREQGSISVLYRVSDTGDAAECAVLTSSGFPLLDEAACRVVARWKFKPATQQGKPTSSLVRANIVFQVR